MLSVEGGNGSVAEYRLADNQFRFRVSFFADFILVTDSLKKLNTVKTLFKVCVFQSSESHPHWSTIDPINVIFDLLDSRDQYLSFT